MESKEFKLLEIELFNVFNYRGHHKIDFRTDSRGNVFLFDIKNGGGKTSLFLSIKWGFYGFGNGVKYEKDGAKLSAEDFMNQDERDSGVFYVRIRFEYDGVEMCIRRECTDYRNNKIRLTLEIEGRRSETDAVAEEHISQMIPPDYGDFFMFNGEVLNDIAMNQRSKEKVDGVLKLLGLKQLSDLRNLLQSIKEGMENNYYNNILKNNEHSALLEQIRQKREELERVDADLKTTGEERAALQAQFEHLEEQRRMLSDAEGLMNKLGDMKKKEVAAQSTIDGLLSAIEKNSTNAFLLFIHDDLNDLIKKLENERREINQQKRSSSDSKGEFAYLTEAIVAGHLSECPACRSMLTSDQISKLQAILSESDAIDEDYAAMQDRYREIKDTIALLKECYDQEPLKLNELCDNLFDRKEDLRKIRKESERMEGLLAESEVDAIKDITNKLIELNRKRQNVEGKYNKLRRLSEAGKREISNLDAKRKAQAKLSQQEQLVSNRIAYVGKLLVRVDSVIKNTRSAKRADILNRANEVFMSITNKPDVYRGLAYDDGTSFSMHIVRRDGEETILPSSGEKHVLAISFLISLSLNTERLSPMMMDTPLSRLDIEHKRNIGTMLSKLDNQVLFLAQPGELDAETRNSLKGAVARMYESRPTGDNTACIKEVPI